MSRRTHVAIVCVANDSAVREHCLDRSIAEHRHEAPATEYIPVDNSQGAFASAGAALNHGVSLAHNEVVVFVHQDVYLHSLAALEEAAGMLADHPEIGVHGSVGITADGRIVGRMRDRVVLIGEPAAEPVDVDSLDEVLFMVPREELLREPLSASPDLAWHAYAVEYGLRMRAQGRRVTAGDIPLTHNSMSVNLDRLDVAHRALAARYPAALPLRTTCGVVTSTEPVTRPLKAHRWRYRWLRESLVAHMARNAVGGGPVVLSDIRQDVDDAIAGASESLEVLNLDRACAGDDPLRLQVGFLRRDQALTVTSMTMADLTQRLAARDGERPLLITNLAVSDLRALRALLPTRRRLVGYHENTGCWLLLGEPAMRVTQEPFTLRRARPCGMARARPA